MARIGRGNTFDFVAKLFYACFLLSFAVGAVYAADSIMSRDGPFAEMHKANSKRIASWWLAGSAPCLLIGVFAHGVAEVVHHLMQISQNTRDTARKLQEMSVPRDSDQPPFP